MPTPRRAHQQSTRALSAVLAALGIAILIRTIAAGGSAIATGVLLGVMFFAAGAGRLYVESRRRR